MINIISLLILKYFEDSKKFSRIFFILGGIFCIIFVTISLSFLIIFLKGHWEYFSQIGAFCEVFIKKYLDQINELYILCLMIFFLECAIIFFIFYLYSMIFFSVVYDFRQFLKVFITDYTKIFLEDNQLSRGLKKKTTNDIEIIREGLYACWGKFKKTSPSESGRYYLLHFVLKVILVWQIIRTILFALFSCCCWGLILWFFTYVFQITVISLYINIRIILEVCFVLVLLLSVIIKFDNWAQKTSDFNDSNTHDFRTEAQKKAAGEGKIEKRKPWNTDDFVYQVFMFLFVLILIFVKFFCLEDDEDDDEF